MSPIERYLVELRRALGPWPKRRVLAEVDDHLRESAASVGEEEAIRRFGPPHELTRAVLRPWTARVAALAVLAVLVSPVLLYPVVENSLPPAPWPGDRPPGYLHWKQDKIVQLFLLALGAGVVAALTWRRFERIRLVALAGAATATTGMAILGAVLSVQWAEAVPGTPGWLALVWFAQLAFAVAAGGLVVRAAKAAF